MSKTNEKDEQKIVLSEEDQELMQFMIRNEKKYHCLSSTKDKEKTKGCYTDSNRIVTLNWLTTVCEEFKLGREAFYLAASYLDSYFFIRSQTPTQKPFVDINNLQLLAIACILIASKFEEQMNVSLAHFAALAGEEKPCTIPDLKTMEMHVLKTLNFGLHITTPYAWFMFFSERLQLESIRESAFVVLDLCMLDPKFRQFYPSQLAATLIASCHLPGTNIPPILSWAYSHECGKLICWLLKQINTIKWTRSISDPLEKDVQPEIPPIFLSTLYPKIVT